LPGLEKRTAWGLGVWKQTLSSMNSYLPLRFCRSAAFSKSSAFGTGLAFFFRRCQMASLSGPWKGLIKSGPMTLFTFDMFKNNNNRGNLKLAFVGVYPFKKYLENSSRDGVRACSVTNLPSSETTTATEIARQDFVRPVTTYTSNPSVALSVSQNEKLHSITSSNSLVDRIPMLWRLNIESFVWS